MKEIYKLEIIEIMESSKTKNKTEFEISKIRDTVTRGSIFEIFIVPEVIKLREELFDRALRMSFKLGKIEGLKVGLKGK